jgi:hypothetical protein
MQVIGNHFHNSNNSDLIKWLLSWSL